MNDPAIQLTNMIPDKTTKTFAYHKPGSEGLRNIQTLRKEFTNLAHLIQAVCPASREKSVALTELETTAMWAIKAVVLNDPESTVEE